MSMTADTTTEAQNRQNVVDLIRRRAADRLIAILPPPSTAEPAALREAFGAYRKAVELYQEADTDLYSAEGVRANAALTEGREIAAAVRAGDDPLSISDKVVEADRDHRRAVSVLTVRANDLQTARAHLIAIADVHRSIMREAAQPAIDEAGRALDVAIRNLNLAKRDLNTSVNVASWWDNLKGTGNPLPDYGRTTKLRDDPALGEYAVLDSAAATVLNSAGMDPL